MPLAKRIIPCLDVKDGQVVKGTNFASLKRAGNPIELAKKYCSEGADELVFLDISAALERRKTRVKLVRRIANEIDIPFTIGGGISSVADARKVLTSGADKVSINTAAVNNPDLIGELSEIFGSQCVVVAVDAKRSRSTPSGFAICTYGGKKETGIDAVEWTKKVQELGAGEVLLTSIDRDGTKLGYDLELTKAIVARTRLPIIASGGCGSISDFYKILTGRNCADAALAASIFHYDGITANRVKSWLQRNGIVVRL